MDFIIDAIAFIADHGYKLLTLYELDVEAAVYHFRGAAGLRLPQLPGPRRAPRSAPAFGAGLLGRVQHGDAADAEHVLVDEREYFATVMSQAHTIRRYIAKHKPEPASDIEPPLRHVSKKDWARLCFWLTPHEAHAYLAGKKKLARAKHVMLKPRTYA